MKLVPVLEKVVVEMNIVAANADDRASQADEPLYVVFDDLITNCVRERRVGVDMLQYLCTPQQSTNQSVNQSIC